MKTFCFLALMLIANTIHASQSPDENTRILLPQNSIDFYTTTRYDVRDENYRNNKASRELQPITEESTENYSNVFKIMTCVLVSGMLSCCIATTIVIH